MPDILADSFQTRTLVQTHLLRKDSKSADLVFGSISGLFARLIEHPFDTIKVRLQTSTKTTTFDLIKSTFCNEGLSGFYKGLSVPLLGSVLETAVIFTSYNHFQSILKNGLNSDGDDLSISQLCLAGSLSGCIISFVLTPIELVKCNLQVLNKHGNMFDGPFNVIQKTISERGFAGMYRGLIGTIMRESVGGAFWFGSYEISLKKFIAYESKRTKKVVDKQSIHPIFLMAAGAIAGMTFNAAFFPADVVKSRHQTLPVASKKSYFAVGWDLYRERGVKAFFRGFTLTVLRSAPTSAALFSVYELLNREFST